MKRQWITLALLLLLSPPLAADPPRVFRGSTDPVFGTLTAAEVDLFDLSGLVWLRPGNRFERELRPSDWALVRVAARTPGVLYLDPYPTEAGPVTVHAVEHPLIFADGFESGAWFWSASAGAVTSPWPAGGEAEARIMANSVLWYQVHHLVGVDSGGTPKDFILSEVIGGATASTDTPASVPYRPVLRPASPASWAAIRTEAGWIDIGGVVAHGGGRYSLIADNRRNSADHDGPLDDMRAYNFKGQQIISYAVYLEWDAVLSRWYPQDLADAQVLWIGKMTDRGSFSGLDDAQFSVQAEEQTARDLRVPSSPVEYLGLGGGVTVENGGAPTSGARILRLDDASLRGTGSQWFSFGLYHTDTPSGTTEITILDSPIFRVRWDGTASPYKLKVQLRNAAGTWVTIGTSPTVTARKFSGVLANYDSTGTPSAELWVNGVSVGSTTITGGIYAASSATTRWYNTPSAGLLRFTHFFFRHGTRLLTDAEIPDRSQYSFDFANELSLDCAIEFSERTGTRAADMAQVQGAVLTDFTDADGAWSSSATGEASLARSRPRVIVGLPFLPIMESVDAKLQIYSPGYPGSRITGTYESAIKFHSVVANGARLDATIATTSSQVDFNATTQEVDITDSEFSADPSIGQSITFSAGANAGAHVVAQILRDPRLPGTPNADDQGVVMSGSVTTDETATVGDWSSAAGDWAAFPVYLVSGLPAVQVTANANDNMSVLFTTLGNAVSLAEEYLEQQGPVAGTVTKTNILSQTLGMVGWQGDGALSAAAHADTLARVTPSNSDYAPSVIYRDEDGDWQLRGADLSPSSVIYEWDEVRIKSATLAALPGDYDKVRVRYSKNWSPVEPGALPADSLTDALAREASIEWREVISGTGASELVLETYFLFRSDAQAFADAMAGLLTNGLLYIVELDGPILASEAAMSPFTAVGVTWPADTYLVSGANGIVVEWLVNADKSARALVLFGGS